MNRNLYHGKGLDNKVDWRSMLSVLLLLVAFLGALLFVSWNDGRAERSATRVETAKRVTAERNLAHCMNGGWFATNEGAIINCGRAL